MAILEELQEGHIKQREKINERQCPPCSWTKKWIIKIGDKTSSSSSYFNSKLIIASLYQRISIQLANIYGTSSLKLPMWRIRTDNDEGKYIIRAEDSSAHNGVVLLDMTANQQHHQNLLISVGDQQVTRFSDISCFRSCSVNILQSLRHIRTLFSYSNTRRDDIPKQAAGVGKVTQEEERSLTNNEFNCSAVNTSRNEKGRSRLKTNTALKVKKEYVLLPAATLLAIVMFTAACHFPRFINKANYIYNYDTGGRIVQEKRDLNITSTFILFNSTGFIVSLAIVISILRGFPLKPWPQISVSTLFGTYMCLIMKISPLESRLVLFLSVPLLLLASVGKLCDCATLLTRL